MHLFAGAGSGDDAVFNELLGLIKTLISAKSHDNGLGLGVPGSPESGSASKW